MAHMIVKWSEEGKGTEKWRKILVIVEGKMSLSWDAESKWTSMIDRIKWEGKSIVRCSRRDSKRKTWAHKKKRSPQAVGRSQKEDMSSSLDTVLRRSQLGWLGNSILGTRSTFATSWGVTGMRVPQTRVKKKGTKRSIPCMLEYNYWISTREHVTETSHSDSHPLLWMTKGRSVSAMSDKMTWRSEWMPHLEKFSKNALKASSSRNQTLEGEGSVE